MQVSLTERLVDRLIGAAAIPGTQHDKRSATPDVTSNVETPGASAHILCAGASEKPWCLPAVDAGGEPL